ncbi:2-hydroxyacid dehydrogenase [Roseomonas elaeocarpi]|uniref:2-hydroxyacid dehydrogenase n=1 Tax=Roseomonas elaeocarpi TaxID=907779 RepID=A0ABV6JSG8_9PROT
MAILCRLHTAYGDALMASLRAALPEEELRPWPETGDPDEIEICMVYRMEPGFLGPFRNLRMISSTGAGIDHFLGDPALPRDVPLVRVVDEEFASRMADYVLCWTMFHHRDVAHFLAAQRRREWAYRTMRPASEVSVGVMGLGQMGGLTARRLVAQGYRVRGWSRTPREIEGVESFHGREGFGAFLRGTEILVNLLALTPETRDILCASTFGQMPAGGVVISAGRGGHLVEEDLIAALRSGQLRGATIDAFRQEPLPPEHPFWTTPGLVVTPHASSTASLETTVNSFRENVRRLRAGEPLLHRVDLDRGY